MRIIQEETFNKVYEMALEQLLEYPEHTSVSPRGMEIKEIEDMILVLDNPYSNLFHNKFRSIPLNYLAGELIWYFSGRRDLAFIKKFSSFWDKLSDDGKNVNSAYGDLLFTINDTADETNQWTWALNSLLHDKDSRQAIMHFNRPEHQFQGVKDFVCTLGAQFLIRDNRLNMKVIMRSNDIYYGLTYDLPFFTLLQQQMLRHLRVKYDNLEMGNYLHHAMSFHCYDRNFSDLQNMLEEQFNQDGMPELDTDLIFPNGRSSYNLVQLMDAVENNKKYETTSAILNWLYNNARKVRSGSN